MHGGSLRLCCGRGFEDAYAAARELGTADGAAGDARSRKRKGGKVRGAANPTAARATGGEGPAGSQPGCIDSSFELVATLYAASC